MTTALATLTSKLASRLEMGNGAELIETLKATAFKGQVTDAQMTALMVVANQYGLNPWTREIYAFPDKNNGIVPVVGVDGWARIINDHPQFDGVEFEQNDESCTCVIYRKDRTRPVKVTEWKSECVRDGFGPWKSHPKRMLRHKALIQCARLAFGYGGIYDQDEAERIVEIDGATGEIFNKKSSENLAVNVVSEQSKSAEKPTPNDDDWRAIQKTWYQRIADKKRTPEQLIDFLEKSWTLADKHKSEIEDWGL
jgi:phage recombination protein Bet